MIESTDTKLAALLTELAELVKAHGTKAELVATFVKNNAGYADFKTLAETLIKVKDKIVDAPKVEATADDIRRADALLARCDGRPTPEEIAREFARIRRECEAARLSKAVRLATDRPPHCGPNSDDLARRTLPSPRPTGFQG